MIFDQSKEEFVVIHGREGEGNDFRYLGTWMDTALKMGTNIDKILARTRPKTTALLRSKRFYTTRDMVQQYKTHILCHLECNSSGFYHALDTVLGKSIVFNPIFFGTLAYLPRKLFSNITSRLSRFEGILPCLDECSRASTRRPTKTSRIYVRFKGVQGIVTRRDCRFIAMICN